MGKTAERHNRIVPNRDCKSERSSVSRSRSCSPRRSRSHVALHRSRAQRDKNSEADEQNSAGNADENVVSTAPYRQLVKKDANQEWQAKIRKILESDGGDHTMRPARRAQMEKARERSVYIGSLDSSATEEDIRKVFSLFGEIKSITRPKAEESGRSKGFCFIEFLTQEAAETTARTMDGFMFKGRAIRVGRPIAISNSFKTSGALREVCDSGEIDKEIKQIIHAKRTNKVSTGLFGVTTFQQFANRADSEMQSVNDESRVIRVTNMPEGFKEAEIKQIFDVFGPIMSISFDNLRKEAVVHFFDRVHADTAVATMDAFRIGGNEIRVFFDPRNGESPSCLVVLKHLVKVDELDDNMKEEVFRECKKYGNVLEVRVHVVPETNEVRFFARFQLPEQANRAVLVFNQRTYAKRKIQCEIYSMVAYENKVYDL